MTEVATATLGAPFVYIIIGAVVVIGIIAAIFAISKGRGITVETPLGGIKVEKGENTKKIAKNQLSKKPESTVFLADEQERLLVMSRLVKTSKRLDQLDVECYEKQNRRSDDRVKQVEGQLKTILFNDLEKDIQYAYLDKILFITSIKLKSVMKSIFKANHLSDYKEQGATREAFLEGKLRALQMVITDNIRMDWDSKILEKEFSEVKKDLDRVIIDVMIALKDALTEAIVLAVERDEKKEQAKKEFHEDLLVRIPDNSDLAALISDLL